VILSDELEQWLARHVELVQRGKVNQGDAQKKLRLAERNLERAKRNLPVDADEALINAETAMVNAADAVLAADGFRLRGKTGSHKARFEYPGLPVGFVDHAAYIERARSLRTMAMYDQPDFVSKDEASRLLSIAEELVDSVRRRSR
jgi:uncharacterized protein (UPF0332 family)